MCFTYIMNDIQWLRFMFTLKTHFPISSLAQKVRSCREQFLMTLGTHAVWFGANFMGQQKIQSPVCVRMRMHKAAVDKSGRAVA